MKAKLNKMFGKEGRLIEMAEGRVDWRNLVLCSRTVGFGYDSLGVYPNLPVGKAQESP
jgi:hypothetical protein